MTCLRCALLAGLFSLASAAPALAQEVAPEEETPPVEGPEALPGEGAMPEAAAPGEAAPSLTDALPPPAPTTTPNVPEGYGGTLVLRPLDPELAPSGQTFTHYKGIRRMAQLGASLLALLTASGVGLMTGFGVCCGRESAIAGYTSAILTATLGIGLGVAAAGRSMPPSGSYGWTLLGAAIGSAITSAMMVGGALDGYDRPGLFITGNTLFPVLTTVGAIWAYELSAGDGVQGRRRAVRVAQFLPTVEVRPEGGATVGLAGMF